MSKDQKSRKSEPAAATDTDDWSAPEDAVMVIRAWHEGGTDDRETWHWRGQISHGNTTKRFVGLSRLFSAITSMLGAVGFSQDVEDPDG